MPLLNPDPDPTHIFGSPLETCAQSFSLRGGDGNKGRRRTREGEGGDSEQGEREGEDAKTRGREHRWREEGSESKWEREEEEGREQGERREDLTLFERIKHVASKISQKVVTTLYGVFSTIDLLQSQYKIGGRAKP